MPSFYYSWRSSNTVMNLFKKLLLLSLLFSLGAYIIPAIAHAAGHEIAGTVFIDSNSNGTRETGEDLKNNVKIEKWRNPAQGNNVKDDLGNNNYETMDTGTKGLTNGRYRFYNLPSGNKYKIKANVPTGFTCTTGNSCQRTGINLNGNKTYSFGIKQNTDGDGDGDGQCKDDKRVKPTVKAQPVGAVQLTGDLNGDYYEKVFTFKVSNKNPKNAKCGKRDYQLQAVPAVASWGSNPPSFEFRSPMVDGKVLDVKPGNPAEQLKLFVKVFKTTPAGTYNFSVRAQDTEDSESTRMSDNLQFRFVVPQGDNNDTCTDNSGCSAPSPICKLDTGACVECLEDTDCAEEGQICNTNNICVDEDDGGGSADKIKVRLGLDGIGTTGSLQEPSCKFTTNPPEDKERTLTLKISSSTTEPLTLNDTAQYEDYTRASTDACPPATKMDKGKFIAEFDLPAGFASKSYNVDVSSNDSPNLHQTKENFAINTSGTILDVDLPAGDIDKNSDPELRIDINDWNILRTCQKKSGSPASCAVGTTTYKTDLDDDGKTDADDMTLFIQEFFYRNR
ncbi:MAG: hypothetical protein UU45_C0008G0008 [Candidatus Levybacteria bacterium GW2011_GWA2_41_15]|nr:MAG: hypothetical protein UU45_C0008G0008 [Candidatus Levybacteria bacterium GW2011_GWA2_41_15]